MRCLSFLLLLILPNFSDVTAQTDRTFLATEDNTLYDPLGSPIENSNGIGDYIFAGVANGNGIRRALVKFNLTTLPDNITITAAKLTLRVSRKFDDMPYNFAAHRVTRFWTEGSSNAPGAEGNGTTAVDFDCTWTRNVIIPNLPDSMWNTAGGDFVPTISAMTEIADEVKMTAEEYDAVFMGTQLTADVQFMVDNAAYNNGWIIVQEDDVNVAQITPEPPRAAVRFRSANSSPTNFTPKLELTYVEGSPLAVKLQDFHLREMNNQAVQLTWSIAESDIGNHFLLEKSPDGTHFYLLTKMEKNNQPVFQYIDNQPVVGVNYYRLRLIDANENQLITQTKAIEITPTIPFAIQILNNGQHDNLSLKINADTAQQIELTVFDLNGKQLLRQPLAISVGEAVYDLNVPDYGAGNYLINIQNQHHQQTLSWQRF